MAAVCKGSKVSRPITCDADVPAVSTPLRQGSTMDLRRRTGGESRRGSLFRRLGFSTQPLFDARNVIPNSDNSRVRNWQFIRRLRFLPVLLCFALAAACGGGGSETSPPPPPPPPASFVNLVSDLGDYIGQGLSYSYSQSNALMTVTAQGGHLNVNIRGDQSWQGDFQLPNSYTKLETGTYGNLTRYPFHDPAVGGLSWSGEGRGCNTLTGSFTITKVTYTGNSLSEIDLQFVQYCEGGSFALHGEIYWNASDTASPPGPVVPPPTNLWQPAPGTTPATGSYVYLESEPGDYIGSGADYLYTNATAMIAVSEAAGNLSVSVNGNEQWSGNFQAMSSLNQLAVGYYGNLERYPFNNPVKGGLSWYGEGRGCNTLSGWFVVDSVTYSGSTVTAIDLRFEQHCEGGTAALHGKIHLDATDMTSPPGPVVPPPAGLWQPTAGSTPATGNYVYLESQPGDYIGLGANYLYTNASAMFNFVEASGYLSVSVTGDKQWSGDFKAMNSLSQLVVGYYGNLERFPFNNPVTGGLSWDGDGRGCNTLTGWFVVDSVTYNGSTMTAIDLRFEQHCEGGAPALHGKIHWNAADTTSPPGPVVPPPAGLWQPAAGTTPATGSYVYLASDAGDYIGQGTSYLYAPSDTPITVSATGARLDVSIGGAGGWVGNFQGMNILSQLEPGYYGDLERYPFNNPVKGGLTWYGEGRGCNTLTGWFVVDGVTYSGSTLTAIDLRFEQHCEGGGPALHGQIHWAP